jgi:hypothetical protein
VRAVVDRSAELARLNALAKDEERQAQIARQRLATGKPRRLSELPVLTERELELLLDLLGQALGGEPNALRSIEAVSEDGTLLITIAPAHPSAPPAIVSTENGTMKGPDYTITISDVDAESGAEATLRAAS